MILTCCTKQNLFVVGVSIKVKTHDIYPVRKHERTYVQTVEMRQVIDSKSVNQGVLRERVYV